MAGIACWSWLSDTETGARRYAPVVGTALELYLRHSTRAIATVPRVMRYWTDSNNSCRATVAAGAVLFYIALLHPTLGTSPVARIICADTFLSALALSSGCAAVILKLCYSARPLLSQL